MISIAYISVSNVAGAIAEILRIRDRSVARNTKSGITGCLYCDLEVFFQVLEGGQAEVMATMRRICRDQRHKDINVVDGKTIKARRFAQWNMKLVSGISNPVIGERFTRQGFLNCDRNFLSARVVELAEM